LDKAHILLPLAVPRRLFSFAQGMGLVSVPPMAVQKRSTQDLAPINELQLKQK
jgi:hypothetical protein